MVRPQSAHACSVTSRMLIEPAAISSASMPVTARWKSSSSGSRNAS